MIDPASSQALHFTVDQVVGGQEYAFKVECDFKGSHLWRVWVQTGATWQSTSVGCSPFTANSWNHLIFRFERTTNNQLHYRDMVINDVSYNFDILEGPVSNTNPDSVTVRAELVEDGTPHSYSVWTDELSLASI